MYYYVTHNNSNNKLQIEIYLNGNSIHHYQGHICNTAYIICHKNDTVKFFALSNAIGGSFDFYYVPFKR